MSKLKHRIFNAMGFRKRRLSAIDLLLQKSPIQIDPNGRIAMAISCKDCEAIPKVRDAGRVVDHDGKRMQIMHNGVKVLADGYNGEWMTHMIELLRGHHEPQEEKVFYEVLKRIPSGGTMVELGSYWAYYSLWFHKSISGASNICCEPHVEHLELGRLNAHLNHANITFHHGAAGSRHGQEIPFILDAGKKIFVPVLSVDGLLREASFRKLDLLHLDVQGAELDALVGAQKSVEAGNVRFIVISTHHYSFSRDPMTHQKCLAWIRERGGSVVASHTVLESFSGDGLIVASFDKADRDFTVETSLNHTDRSFFRPYEEDLDLLMKEYNGAFSL